MPCLDYLKTYSSKNTVRNYRLALRRFLSVTYGIEIASADLELEKFAKSYIDEKRDRQRDLDAFLASIKGSAPLTIRLEIAGVKTFLVENGIELPQLYWRRLRGKMRGSRALTLDKVPSNAELKRIIMNMPAQGKALYLSLASSGMRIGEALRLKLGDVELDKEPCAIRLKGEYTKTGNSRITFISNEAKETLQEWIRIRQTYLEAASRKSRHPKAIDDARIFPFDFPTAYSLWDKAVARAGLNEKDSQTNRSKVHPHVLRKFFRRLGAVIPVDIVEALMGHEGYLTEVYRKYAQEDLAEFYKKGESALMVFGNGAEVSKLKVEIEEKSKTLNEGMTTLALKNADLENRLTAFIAENQDLRRQVNELNQTVGEIKKVIDRI